MNIMLTCRLSCSSVLFPKSNKDNNIRVYIYIYMLFVVGKFKKITFEIICQVNKYNYFYCLDICICMYIYSVQLYVDKTYACNFYNTIEMLS